MTTQTKKRTTQRNIWQTLSSIDCSEHIEKKNGFNYISWAWAWGILMDNYPESTFENHLDDKGYPCFLDVNGNAVVRVTLFVDGKSHTEDLPVLDYRNKAITNPDSFQVNTALKRCLVKVMAYFGLGHYVYAGEDLPQETIEKNRETLIESVHNAIAAQDESWAEKVFEWAKVDNVGDMTTQQLNTIIERLGESNGS